MINSLENNIENKHIVIFVENDKMKEQYNQVLEGAYNIIATYTKGICEKRGISPLEIDMIIVGTVTSDHRFPSTSNLTATWGTPSQNSPSWSQS